MEGKHLPESRQGAPQKTAKTVIVNVNGNGRTKSRGTLPPVAVVVNLLLGEICSGASKVCPGLRAPGSRSAAHNKSISICRVAIGMRSAPVPRAAHDANEACILRFPAQFALDFFRTGHKYSRIAGPAR